LNHETGAIALLCVAMSAACSDATPPNVLIITVDTLRADYLGPYGDLASNTPNLDALARSAALFEHAAAPMPMTRPSHFSMLTSKYPREHGVVNNTKALPDSALSLAEILDDEGYWTGAFVGVRLLRPRSGAAQGYDHFDYPEKVIERPAERVVSRALHWLGNVPDEAPFLLWVHLFDPHIPYAPPPEFRPKTAEGMSTFDWQLLREIAEANLGDLPEEALQQALSLYRGEISYTDHWIGELLHGVDQRFDPSETLVVFASDHGECFENGVYFEHANCLSESSLRVPMMIRYPPDFAPGIRSEANVSLLDILPTILHAAELEVAEEFSGLPLQQADAFGDRQLLIQRPQLQRKEADSLLDGRRQVRTVAGQPILHEFRDSKRVGLIGTNWIYLRGTGQEVLYRFSALDKPTRDLSETHPAVRQELSRQLRKLLRATKRRNLGEQEVDEDLAETLEALGYVN